VAVQVVNGIGQPLVGGRPENGAPRRDKICFRISAGPLRRVNTEHAIPASGHNGHGSMIRAGFLLVRPAFRRSERKITQGFYLRGGKGCAQAEEQWKGPPKHAKPSLHGWRIWQDYISDFSWGQATLAVLGGLIQ